MNFLRDLFSDLISWIVVTVFILGICIKLCELV